MRTRHDNLAPSIRKAHTRVQIGWYASVVHAVLLLAFGLHFFFREPPAWLLGALCMLGVALVPRLGRAAYHGHSLSAFVLVLTVVVPPVTAFFTEWDLRLALPGILLLPPYYLGLKGATGLRGRRSGTRLSAGKASSRKPSGKSSPKGKQASAAKEKKAPGAKPASGTKRTPKDEPASDGKQTPKKKPASRRKRTGRR